MEIWKDINGYYGFYQVSNIGNVRSLNRVVPREGKGSLRLKGHLKLSTVNNRGYYSTTLCKNGIYRHFAIHCLVARAFIENLENKEYVNHKDGNKLNNCVSNLEWNTMSENNKHAYDTGLKKGSALGLYGINNPSSKSICMVDINTNEIIREYPAIHDAARKLNLSATGICAAIKGRSNSCGGFKWIYKSKAA